MEKTRKMLASNRRAAHDYAVLETYQAGIVLLGREIKSLRLHGGSFTGAYISIDHGEVWLHGLHIGPMAEAAAGQADPDRAKKLLLNKRKIRKLAQDSTEKGLTIIPTQIYLEGQYAKIDICLAKGKKLYDKRADLKKRDVQREIERSYTERK